MLSVIPPVGLLRTGHQELMMHESGDRGAEAAAIDRRGFLGWVAVTMSGLVAVCGGLTALVYVSAPALRRGGEATDTAWSAIPDAASVTEPTSHAVSVVTDAGWAKTQATGAIFVDRAGDGSIRAFSARCPH